MRFMRQVGSPTQGTGPLTPNFGTLLRPSPFDPERQNLA